VESGRGRRGQHCGPVFLHEGLQNEVVRVAAGERGLELIAHAVGVGAAHVVALQQDLTAAAGADHLVAELLEASVVARSHQQDSVESDHQQLEAAAHQSPPVRATAAANSAAGAVARAVTACRLGTSATSVPKTTMYIPIHNHATSGFR